MEIRLNKYLKDKGLCSRRKADEFIEKGYITVNGEVVTELGKRIDDEKDIVAVSQEAYKEKKEFRYILLYKPQGYVTTKSEGEGKNVFDLVPEIEGLTYAGRLDKDSEGLLIFSNDGEFVYGLTYPEFEKEKEYSVEVDREVTEEKLDIMRKGMIIQGKMTKPAVVTKTGKYSYNIILTEGMNRQIRRMARRVDWEVMTLIRFRIKEIRIEKMKAGEWRNLTSNEIESLKRQA